MKNLTLILCLVLGVYSVNAQTQIDLPITWDVSTVNYNTTPFGGTSSSAVVADPLNASNSVLQFTKPTDAPVWAGVTFGDVNVSNAQLANPIPFSATANTISVKVYSPDAGITVRLKVEGGVGQQCETDATTTVANAWETLIFDFTNNAIPADPINYTYTYQKLVIFFNFGVDGATAGLKTYYADSIMFGGTVVPPPPSTLDTIDLPITWDDTANINYTTIAFEGGQSFADLDPTDPTNNVLKFTKPSGAQAWAGVTLGNQVLENPIPFTGANKFISVKVYSPAAGMPIMLKAEVQGGPGVEAQALSTVANQWETLSIDFNSPLNGTIDTNLNYNMLSFFGDFLTAASGQVFYIDSVFFGLPVAPPVPDSSFVTFQLDMNQVTAAFTTPEVNGEFNGWCGNCNSMSDANSDNIWDITINLPVGETYEFKYSADTWTIQETNDPAGACTNGNTQFTNRVLVVPATDTVMPAVCWGSCLACTTAPALANVTFRVDMSLVAEAFTTPEVNGEFNGWCGNCNAMTDVNADNIWEATISLPIGDTLEYKFSADVWTIQETNDPAGTCTNGNTQFTNRVLVVPTTDVILDEVCWGSCFACDTTNSINELDLNNRLSVYPNPTSNVLYVNGDLDAAAQFTLTITDMFGKLVINRTMTGAELQTINTSTLPNGIYLLSVDNELSVFSTKVVVSH
jgi:hypothetical protein